MKNVNAPGSWIGLQCHSVAGCLVNVFARKNACTYWAIRLEGKTALRTYAISDLRFSDGYTGAIDTRLKSMPLLRRSQALAIFNQKKDTF